MGQDGTLLTGGAAAVLVVVLGLVGAALATFAVALVQADAGMGRGGWAAPVAGLTVVLVSLLFARTLLKLGRRR